MFDYGGMADGRCILFTAFEPSGDEHAAPVIAALRRFRPDVPIYALGGGRMDAAGAELIEHTTGRPTMLLGVIGQARAHRQRLARLKQWLNDHPVAIHVPTDSPAANWSICKLVKRHRNCRGAKVVHLVAPQVWAWASWRVRRLRKWSDGVLCLLPFEPTWFAARGVEARFIGHPLFDEPLDPAVLRRDAAGLPVTNRRRRIALLPGSRDGEIRANWPIMARVASRLALRWEGDVSFIVAAANAHGARLCRELAPADDAVAIVHEHTDAVLHWADAVLTVSGTATLHVARHLKPMAVIYKVNPVAWHGLGRWLIHTRTFALPNLIAQGGPASGSGGGHIVRELIPWLDDDVTAIADEMQSLVEDEGKRQTQIDALRRVTDMFAGHHAGEEAAQAIAELL